MSKNLNLPAEALIGPGILLGALVFRFSSPAEVNVQTESRVTVVFIVILLNVMLAGFGAFCQSLRVKQKCRVFKNSDQNRQYENFLSFFWFPFSMSIGSCYTWLYLMKK